MTNRDSALIAAALCGVLATAIWGGFPAITKLSMQSDALTAWDVTALRFGVGGLLLLPVFLKHGFGGLAWPKALLLTCGAGAPYVLLTAGGLAFAPPAHMGVITPSCMLVFSTLGSRLRLGDPLSPSRIGGVAIIVAGIAMIGWHGLASDRPLTWLGDLMFAVGGLFWATYTVSSRVFGVNPFRATAVVACVSMLVYVPVYWLFGDPRIGVAPWRDVVMQGVFQGVLSAVVALLLYTRAVAVLGAARGALFGALVPAFTLIINVLVLAELPTRVEIGGVALVSAGMVLALGLYDRAARRQARGGG